MQIKFLRNGSFFKNCSFCKCYFGRVLKYTARIYMCYPKYNFSHTKTYTYPETHAAQMYNSSKQFCYIYIQLSATFTESAHTRDKYPSARSEKIHRVASSHTQHTLYSTHIFTPTHTLLSQLTVYGS